MVRDSNDAITAQDLDGRIVAWNPRAVRMYGYSETEALTMRIADIVPKDRRKEAMDLLQRTRRGESVDPFGTRRLAKDGRVLDVWLTISVLVDDAGNPRGLATTERELSQRS